MRFGSPYSMLELSGSRFGTLALSQARDLLAEGFVFGGVGEIHLASPRLRSAH